MRESGFYLLRRIGDGRVTVGKFVPGDTVSRSNREEQGRWSLVKDCIDWTETDLAAEYLEGPWLAGLEGEILVEDYPQQTSRYPAEFKPILPNPPSGSRVRSTGVVEP